MEAEEEVRSVEGWAPGADGLGLILQLLFLSLAPKPASVLLRPSPPTAVPVSALPWVATLDTCSPSLPSLSFLTFACLWAFPFHIRGGTLGGQRGF